MIFFIITYCFVFIYCIYICEKEIKKHKMNPVPKFYNSPEKYFKNVPQIKTRIIK